MMRNILSFVLVGLISVSFSAFAKEKVTKLNAGAWRFELKTTHATVPFIMDFKWKGKKLEATLHNGKETIKLKNITYKKDELIIHLQTYPVTLELTMESREILSGFLVRHNKNPIIKTPLKGRFEKTPRFGGASVEPVQNISGRWAVSMVDEDDKINPGVVIFEQKGTNLTGSILTPTGDYRYFEGYVSGEDFEAASFDGVFFYIFKGKIKKDIINAEFLTNYKLSIEGKRDAKAELPNAYAQTQLEALEFTFPDLSGKKVSLSDAKFKNRPVIVQFFGSWCPNCIDEMNFLIPWYKLNHKRGIDIIALSFERALDLPGAKIQLAKVQKAKKIPYTLLLAGATAEDKPMDKIPKLKNFISFPTTVFLNRKHEVVKVHAGFTGPGTGEFFDKWKQEFNQTVNELLK